MISVKGYGSTDANNSVDDGIEWTKAMSKNGVPFEVGINRTQVTGASLSPLSLRDMLKKYSQDHQKEFKGRSVLQTYKYPVNWPVGDDTWKQSPALLAFDWIPQYKLHDNGASIYSYRLDFTSKTGGSIHYYFYDESGDYYRVFVVLSGDHYVRYNSNQPTIIRVEVLPQPY